jgi:hypothetical protein
MPKDGNDNIRTEKHPHRTLNIKKMDQKNKKEVRKKYPRYVTKWVTKVHREVPETEQGHCRRQWPCSINARNIEIFFLENRFHCTHV